MEVAAVREKKRTKRALAKRGRKGVAGRSKDEKRPRFDPAAEISAKIAAAIEAGTPPWRCPWTGSVSAPAFPLRSTGEAYRGINVLMLWLTAMERGYAAPTWMTYRQASALGGQVRKGEKSALVVKYGTFEAKDEDGKGSHSAAGASATEADEDRTRAYLKRYRVFNVEQIDGLPERYAAPRWDAPQDMGTRRDDRLEAYFSRLGARIETSPESRAYYRPAEDLIHMPPVETFHTVDGYYETLGHEVVHWTGGRPRLDRIGRNHDRTAYAFEELVAEIGQCMLFATIGLTPLINQSAAYVEGWLKALKDDSRMILKAAGEAQKAVDYITERCGLDLDKVPQSVADEAA